MEQWLPCPGFPIYEVSSLGRVRSINRTKCDPVFYKPGTVYLRIGRKGRVLKQSHIMGKNGSWYAVVGLYHGDGSKPTTTLVHRIVCEAFHGQAPESKPTVEHDDGNGLNNVCTNLYWASYSEQREGERVRGTLRLAERHYKSIMTTEQVNWVKAVYVPNHPEFGRNVLANKFGVSPSTIGKITCGKNRKDG